MQQPGRLRDQAPEWHPCLGIGLRQLAELLDCLLGITPEQEVTPIQRRREHRGISLYDLDSVTSQRQIADQSRVERADPMRPGVEVEVGEDLLGHRRSPHDLPALDHQNLEAGLGQVRRRNQPVVARPDHYHVVHARHHT